MRASKIETNYENFYAECPFCGYSNIFNRREDLNTFEPISRMDVICQSEECIRTFEIGNDSINLPSEMFLMEAKKLLYLKSYMFSITLSVQAVENYISQLFVIELAYKKITSLDELSKLNEVVNTYATKTKGYSFKHQVNALIDYIVNTPNLNGLDCSLQYVRQLPEQQKTTSKNSLENVSKQYSGLVQMLYNTEINSIRNKVAHKQALRPTKEDAEKVLSEASEIIYMAQNIFNARVFDVNYYLQQCI
ncbi:hypothetical protein G3495_20730 [Shewanella baltica]|uniref:hypothetical protein n=1 Tax=Shewanella baltica TaxID=62322 RepID=UPI00217D2015|nr:hypothetical protein [Shewanella baltica]MCS6237514.1 hypothetical protein [Shewanella baltica]MCS6272091.1 hypothetical protein [Shewanella baltica]